MQAAARILENRIPPPVVFVLILGAMIGAVYLLAPSGLQGAASTALALAFFALAGAFGPPAIRRFRRAGTTIDPVHVARASALVTDGIYARSRNPMYVSLAALLAAYAAYAAQAWLALGPVIFVAYITRFQIIPEERVMREKFGAA
jgi:protein-S-isoprenylcysteine O-methyltransferase Ste14